MCNLNRHLSVLQEAGLVRIDKQGGGRSSKTLCVVTSKGRKLFLAYLAELQRVLSDAAAAQQADLHQQAALKFNP